ncbi:MULTISPECIES: hypothetical protein [unclassified Bacillus (in: firmicutes)]|uniref:hypothetical protein n=1 Tax=unclassified Bacillus (in: firmicutes) TaxID=185979 RepID=UPI0008EDC7FA|nr:MULTISPECIES: hypothetical protein [unclassified Bacillus (in: firmicutes)]PGZ90668.1 hypothetical protein COE53_17050 [Bacillus sp. AFS029533]SFD29499.1 hypothetical protein SAMN02799633_03354 [Bacillus sp. UNCCL81]
MTVIEKLASSLGRRNGESNIQLAIKVVDQNDENVVKGLNRTCNTEPQKLILINMSYRKKQTV